MPIKDPRWKSALARLETKEKQHSTTSQVEYSSWPTTTAFVVRTEVKSEKTICHTPDSVTPASTPPRSPTRSESSEEPTSVQPNQQEQVSENTETTLLEPSRLPEQHTAPIQDSGTNHLHGSTSSISLTHNSSILSRTSSTSLFSNSQDLPVQSHEEAILPSIMNDPVSDEFESTPSSPMGLLLPGLASTDPTGSTTMLPPYPAGPLSLSVSLLAEIGPQPRVLLVGPPRSGKSQALKILFPPSADPASHPVRALEHPSVQEAMHPLHISALQHTIHVSQNRPKADQIHLVWYFIAEGYTVYDRICIGVLLPLVTVIVVIPRCDERPKCLATGEKRQWPCDYVIDSVRQDYPNLHTVCVGNPGEAEWVPPTCQSGHPNTSFTVDHEEKSWKCAYSLWDSSSAQYTPRPRCPDSGTADPPFGYRKLLKLTQRFVERSKPWTPAASSKTSSPSFTMVRAHSLSSMPRDREQGPGWQRHLNVAVVVIAFALGQFVAGVSRH